MFDFRVVAELSKPLPRGCNVRGSRWRRGCDSLTSHISTVPNPLLLSKTPGPSGCTGRSPERPGRGRHDQSDSREIAGGEDLRWRTKLTRLLYRSFAECWRRPSVK